jgi:GT2 family glycosyltransferase
MNLAHKFQAEPDIGVINSKIVNAFTRRLDQGPGWSYSEKQKADQDQEFLSWSFSEGGAAIRKQVFDQVGLFWEPLFFGCEGQEFSLRTWDAGFKVLYYPKSIVYHRASPQQRVEEKDRDFLFLRNTLYIYIVRYPLWMLAVLGPLKIGAVMVRSIRRRYLLDVLKVLFEVTKAMPMLLKHRKPICNQTAFFYLKLMRQNGPLSWELSSWIKHKI